MKKIYFAGGCFWGVQAFFKALKGVTKTVVGYANSNVKNPLYSEVKSQTTTAVEAVEVTYDENIISLKRFWCPEKSLHLFSSFKASVSLRR